MKNGFITKVIHKIALRTACVVRVSKTITSHGLAGVSPQGWVHGVFCWPLPHAVLLRLLLSLFLLPCLAHAELTIHITQGTDRPYPIALAQFSGDIVQAEDLKTGISGIIRQDLEKTGRFGFLDSSKFPQVDLTPQSFQFDRWSNLARTLDFVLVGAVESEGDHYRVNIQLASLPDHQILLGKQFDNISRDRLRSLAHHISDLVYQVITGKKGDFSSRIAYISVTDQFDPKKAVYKLFVADSDGYKPKLLLSQKANPIASPSWSFDGQYLAYVTYVNNRMAIYTIELKTGERKMIANYPGINSSPAFSPDGRKMAMALAMGDSDKTDIYLLDLASGKNDRLTQGETSTGAEFSKDGKRIAFTSNRGGSPQIYEVEIASRKVKRITFEGSKNYDAEYTPDGRSLVMMHQFDKEGPIRIARYDFATQKTSVITDGSIDKSPSISPGGNMVLYVNQDRRSGILSQASMNGATRVVVPTQGGSIQSPAWSK